MTQTKSIDVLSSIPTQGARDRRLRRVLFVTDFYLDEVLAGIVAYAREAGWAVHANMRFHGRFPPAAGADGILATATGSNGERVRNWLAEHAGYPIVRMIASRFELPYPSVEIDYRAAGRAGARHLLELGHLHYAFYWVEECPGTREVREGFEAELAAAGRRMHRLDFPAAHPGRDQFLIAAEERRHWLTKELKRLPMPVAIMGDDDRRSLELVSACCDAGLRVPEDVAVLGCDNHWVELGTSPLPLSSVDVNFKGLGWESAALLDRLMNGEATSASPIKVKPQGVVARRSTATFITDSPGITAAVLHLRERFREPLRLAGLARIAGMSERVFESEFKRRVGRSARQEIQRTRLACASRLLRDTDLKLDAIAVESGFGSASKLCVAFASAHNVSPSAWRQRARTDGLTG